MNLTDRIADELTAHDIDLLRLEAGQVRDLLVRLSVLHEEVVGLVKKADITAPTRRGDQLRRLDALRVEMEKRIDTTYAALAQQHARALADLAVFEGQAVRAVVNNTVGGPLLKGALSQEQASKLAANLLVPADETGAPVDALWRLQRNGVKTRLRAATRRAVEASQDLSTLLQVVRGNRALRFRDGILPRSRAQAEALVRTAQAQTANAARMAAYRRNADTVKGVQAQAVLDGRTTITCRVRNGRAWLLDGAAFPGAAGRVPTPEPFPGPPPWHWRCRSTLVPVFYSLEALQEVIDPELNDILVAQNLEVPYDGRPGLVRTFEGWMGTRTEAQQVAAIGRARWELWQDGKIGLSDLLDQRGREMSLADLKEKINIRDGE